MADREDQSNLPPIPDGGLAEAMPEWLRRPPAWRTLPDREIAAPEPEDATGLPEPDDSVIDPRTFLTDDDLPAWLRDLGRGRATRPPAEGEPGDAVVAEAETVPSESEAPDPDRPSERPAPSTPRFVPTSLPAQPVESARPVGAHQVVSRQPPLMRSTLPAWQEAWVVVVLAALLVVAMIVIVILALA